MRPPCGHTNCEHHATMRASTSCQRRTCLRCKDKSESSEDEPPADEARSEGFTPPTVRPGSMGIVLVNPRCNMSIIVLMRGTPETAPTHLVTTTDRGARRVGRTGTTALLLAALLDAVAPALTWCMDQPIQSGCRLELTSVCGGKHLISRFERDGW